MSMVPMAFSTAVPLLHRCWLHQMRAVLPSVQELGKHDPQEAKACREPWARIFLLDATLADNQLTFHCEKPRRQHCSWLQQCHQEHDRISEDLAHEQKGLMGIPPHILKCAQGWPKCSRRGMACPIPLGQASWRWLKRPSE